MGESPFHFRAAQTKKRPDTDILRSGRGTHALTHEPELFRAQWAIWEGASRRGKEWEKFSAQCKADGRDILTQDQFADCQAISQAALSNERAAKYLRGGKAELTVLWTDKATGIECKARIDFLAEDAGAITDLKTSKDVSEEGFTRTSWNFGYHTQAAFYCDGYEAATGRRLPYVIVAVQSSEPHDVVPYHVGPQMLAMGKDTYRGHLETLVWCRAQGRWPGHARDGELQLRPPRWVAPTNDDEEDVAALGLVAHE
jgi:exodeoxyribonuclease VIII